MKVTFVDRATFPASQTITPPPEIETWTDFDNTSPDKIVERCHNAQIILTNKVELNAGILAQLPNLKLICITATGTNNIDLQACAKLNIRVVNAKNYGTESVAEHTLMLMLALSRNLTAYQNANREKHWSSSPFFHDPLAPISQLHGKTLTIVGRGALGLKVSQLCKGLGMKIQFAEHKDATSIRAGYVEFNEALATADVVSLHCPLTQHTKNLINRSALSTMKSSAFLINCGRGDLVNENDLYYALTHQLIAGAGLDVASTEPPELTHPIWQLASLDNVIVTPHIAWASNTSMACLMDQITEKIALFCANKLQENIAQ